jgi:hypothetical protein
MADEAVVETEEAPKKKRASRKSSADAVVSKLDVDMPGEPNLSVVELETGTVIRKF